MGTGAGAVLRKLTLTSPDAEVRRAGREFINSVIDFAGRFGAPAILGAWIGGFAFSPILTAVFLGVGVGAIWQVIVEVGAFLRRHAVREGEALVSWSNVGGFLVGLLIMYLTAFLVSF